MEGDSMTTATVTTTAPAPAHIWRVVRLHFVNKWTTIGVPWLIMAFIFVINLAIWAVILGSVSASDRADVQSGMGFSGATFYIFVYMLVVAVQAVNLTFPFALGFGITRREFYLGTVVAFAILSLFYGVCLTILSYLEEATHGWGLGGHLFTAVYFGNGTWFERLFVFTVGMLFFFFIGAIAATVFVRWKANGLLVAGGILVVVILAVVTGVTLTGSWPNVGGAFVAAGPIGVVAWLLVPTALAAVAGYFVLRRATPRG
jgi:hypothetical protein